MNRYDLMLEILFAMMDRPPVDPDGTHKHQCGYCGCIWEHPNARQGDGDAHTCPECGVNDGGPWYHYDGPDAPDYVEGPDGLPLAA